MKRLVALAGVLLCAAQWIAAGSVRAATAAPAKQPQPAIPKVQGCRPEQSGQSQPQAKTATPLAVNGLLNSQGSPDLDLVLSRASRYEVAYEEQLGNLIGDEVYVQHDEDGVIKQQRTDSDFAILQVGKDWISVRDVNCVDGTAVQRRSEDFEKILAGSPTVVVNPQGQFVIVSAIDNILRENSRYNIGVVQRNTNLPILALQILRPGNVGRFEFKKGGEASFGGIRTWAVGYREIQGPALIHDGDNNESFINGTLWIEPETGHILKTEVNNIGLQGARSFRAQTVVSYKNNPKLEMLVPVSMVEHYVAQHYNANGSRKLDCRADYSNFRRLQVETRLDFGPLFSSPGDQSELTPVAPFLSPPNPVPVRSNISSAGVGPVLPEMTASISQLILKLKDPNPNVQASAALALGQTKDPRAVEPLIAVVTGGEGIRYTGDVKQNAALALGQIKDPRAVKPLIAVLKDGPTASARGLAAMALGQIKDPRAVESLISSLLTDTGRDRGFDRDPQVQQNAAMALGQIQDLRAIKPLITALRDPNSDVRETAAVVLGRIPDPRAVEPLIAALKDKDSDVRVSAASALGQIKDPRAVEPILGILKDTDPEVQQRAGEALATIGTPAVARLIAALKGTDRQLQYLAGVALGAVGMPEVVEPLISALSDTNPDVRKDAATALGQIQDPRAVEPVTALLKDTDSEVRGNAAVVLGQLEDARAVEPLIALLKDTDPKVQQRASEALRVMGTPAIEPLIAALKDVDPDVQQLAGDTLMLMKIGVVAVEPETLKFIDSLGPDFVFFMSSEHPIIRLNDITDPDSQFGVAQFTPQIIALIRQLFSFGAGTDTAGITLMQLGDNGFANLFQEHPQLKLFVTHRGIAGINLIESSGGGLRVRFVESR